MPITSPFMLKSGPPELPGFTAASVWMNGTYVPSGSERAVALTMPAVAVFSKPNGEPIASTHSPTRSLAGSPSFTAGRPLASIFTTAMSLGWSTPSTLPLNSRRSDRRTRTSSAPSTTCALVRITPSDSTMKPEPMPWRGTCGTCCGGAHFVLVHTDKRCACSVRNDFVKIRFRVALGPVRGVAVGPGHAVQHRLVVRLAGDLHAERQATAREAGGNRNGWSAGDVERHAGMARVRFLHRFRILHAARQLEARKRDHGVVAQHQVGEFLAQQVALFSRFLHVLGGDRCTRAEFRPRHLRIILRARAEPFLVNAILLELLDDAPALGPRGELRHPHGLEPGAELAQNAGGVLDAPHVLGVRWRVLGVEVLDDPDAQPVHAGAQLGDVIARCHRLEQQRI